MKKVIVFITVAIATFASYSVSSYFLKLLYIQYPSDFSDDKNYLFVKMILATIVWAGVVALILFLMKKEFKEKDELTKPEKEFREYYSNLFDDLYGWAIGTFALIGIFLMPLLVWVSNDIVHWIVR